MAGSKRERRPGVWELIVYLGRDPVTGKKRWKSETFRGGERTAEKRLAALATELDNEKPSSSQSIGFLLDEYLRLLKRENRSASTLRTYGVYVEKYLRPALGKIRMDKLTAGDVRQLEAMMTEQNKAPSTIRQVHAILRGALKFAMQHDWVERNVASLATPPKLDPTSVVAATPAQADALYRAAGKPGDDLPAAIALATYTGARLGELCALRWSNVDDDVIHFYSSKTHQTGDSPIMATLAERLTERRESQAARAERAGVQLDDDPYILSFWMDGSRKPHPNSYSHAFQRVRDALALPHLHFHTLRHAFVTEALAAGVDPLTVSKLVRHRDMTMIGRVYGHGTAEASRKAGKAIDKAFKAKKAPPKRLPEGAAQGATKALVDGSI